MTLRPRRPLAALAFACLAASSLVAQEIRLRVGTVVPRGSLWYDTLQYIAQDWQRIIPSLKVVIHPDSQLGDEMDMVRKARGGIIEAVGLSSVGLSRIDNSVSCLQVTDRTARFGMPASAPETSTDRSVLSVEGVVALTVLAAMTALPIVEVIARLRGGIGVPGAITLVQHLTLWIALAGAALAARRNQLWSLTTRFLPEGWQSPVRAFTGSVSAAVTTTLVVASADWRPHRA